MRTVVLAFGFSLCLALGLAASEAADRELAKYTAARGDAKIRSRVTEGVIEMRGQAFGFLLLQKAPDHIMMEIQFPNGPVRRGFNGTRAWEQDRDGKVRDLTIPERRTFIEEFALNSLARAREFFTQRDMESGKLHLTRADGSSEYWLLDPVSHLRTRLEKSVGTTPVEIFYEDFRTIDGARLPQLQRTRTGELETVLRAQKIVHNQNLPDARFSPEQ